MRLRRIKRGALTLASPEVKFQIDTETHDPLDIGIFRIVSFLSFHRALTFDFFCYRYVPNS